MVQPVERVQTGVRLEKKTLKVLRALADYLDLGLGDLIEGIVLHSFDGSLPFSATTREQIQRLRGVYGLTLVASDSHTLVAEPSSQPDHRHHTRSGAAAARGSSRDAKRKRAKQLPNTNE
jgi:hypothetical protein